MSLILAIRENGKAYFCSDRRVLCGAIIEREQDKLVVLGSKGKGQIADIVIGVCGNMRILTVLCDPRNQDKLLTAYKEAPTIHGLIDAIKAILESNDIKAKPDPGGASGYNMSLLIAIDSEIYEVGGYLTFDRVPYGELAASGSGSLIAEAFWAGRTGKKPASFKLSQADFADAFKHVTKPGEVIEEALFECMLYAASVDSGVGRTVTGYSYDLKLPA